MASVASNQCTTTHGDAQNAAHTDYEEKTRVFFSDSYPVPKEKT